MTDVRQGYRLLARGSVLFLSAGLALDAAAQTVWDVVPDVGIYFEYHDNPRLQGRQNVADSNRGVVDARLLVTSLGERGSTYFEPRVTAARYSENAYDELNSEDLFLRANGNYSWQRATAAFQARLSRESILSSEILEAEPEDPDLEDPDPVDSGTLNRFQETRNRAVLRPSIEVQLSERTNFRFDLDHQTVVYSDSQTALSTRTDFTSSRIFVGLVRRAGELNRVSAGFLVTDYTTDLDENQTDGLGVEGTFTRELSPTWNFSLSAGVMRHDFTIFETDRIREGADSTPILGIRLRNRGERSTLNIDVERRVTPSARGFVSERNQFRVFYQNRLTERLTGSLAVRLLDTTNIGRGSRRDNRRYGRVELRFNWQMTERLTLDTGYNFTTREFPDATETDGDSNSIRIGVSYRGLSRLGL